MNLPPGMTVEQYVEHLEKQRDDLQSSCDKLLTRCRSIDRRVMVRQFFYVAEQTIPEWPCVPADEVVRFRMRLIAEEFIELLSAMCSDPIDRGIIEAADTYVKTVVNVANVRVNMVDFVDATVDLDYVVEGARIAFGLNSDEFWSEVQRANLSKQGGPVRASDGKRLKPPGWAPPNHVKILKKQGWYR